MLKEILWLMSNLQSYEPLAYRFTNDSMPEQLYLITKKYNANFTFDIWRLLVWNFRMMAITLSLFEQTQIDIEPALNFLLDNKEVICQHLVCES